MKHFRFLLLVLLPLFCTQHTCAQDIFKGFENLFTPPLQYTAHLTKTPVTIDGKLNEPCWQSIPWSNNFVDIEGGTHPAPVLNTRFKLLWDTGYVYIAAELEEPHIQAWLKQHDTIIFLDNDFEVFIDPDGDTQNYFEIEVNPINTIFDLFLPKPYRNGGVPLINWDVQHLRSAIAIKGTLNNSTDKDEKWTVEMAIPLRSISLNNDAGLPQNGTTWRINFSRVEWDFGVAHNKYFWKMDSTNHRRLPEHNWVWSPQGAVNMHFPERWGYLQFSSLLSGTENVQMPLPEEEKYKKYLWLLYYKQQEYRKQHQQFATDLPQLNLPDTVMVDGTKCTFGMEATTKQFSATIQSATGHIHCEIDQDGNITKIKHP